jgi:death-on-curing protein
MSEWVWLNRAVIIAIHEVQLAEHGGGTGVRDAGLPDSALGKPQQLNNYGSLVWLWNFAQPSVY